MPALPEKATLYPAPDLAHLAREARAEAGLTLEEMAERLDVNPATVSRAERDATGSRYVKMQARIIQATGYRVEGPLWRITNNTADQ